MPTMAERAAAAALMEEEDNAPAPLPQHLLRRMSSTSVFEDSDSEAMSEHAEAEEQEAEEYGHMQEVIPGLWLGDIVAAMDEDALRGANITSIMSIIRQTIPAPQGVKQLPLPIDDGPSTDILTHLPTCVDWIQQAIEDGEGGVLVHCQAGMSRSATVVAAYLMRLLSVSPEEAIEMIKEKRNVIQPSDTFMEQLYLYYAAHCRVSTRDRSTRQWYMERNAAQVMNGGEPPAMDKMAKFPATPTPSMPPTPAGGHGRRKIRCKMCRRQLATREHMMDHILDQSPVSRPRTPSTSLYLPSPLSTLGPDASSSGNAPSRHASIGRRPSSGLASRPDMSAGRDPSAGSMDKSRRASESSGSGSGMRRASASTGGGDSLLNRRFVDAESLAARLPPQLAALRAGVPMPSGSMGGSMSASSAVATPSPIDPDAPTVASPPPLSSPGSIPPPAPSSHSRRSSMNNDGGRASVSSTFSMSPSQKGEPDGLPSRRNSIRASGLSMTTDNFSAPSEGQKVAARKLSMMALTPSDPDGSGSSGSAGSSGRPKMSLDTDVPRSVSGSRRNSVAPSPSFPTTGPPILVNPKCSGYFVEPLTWMEPMLEAGEMQGKILCPNEKCNAKIGNYDWAGVQCGCKEWVVPGFCISRSKVDEVW